MIESYLCQDSKKEFNLNLVQIFLLFIDEKKIKKGQFD